MSNVFVPYPSLTEDKKKEAIKLARRQQSLVIHFSTIGLQTQLPPSITILFKCTNCPFILDMHYQSTDWIRIDTDISFACTQGKCKGTLAPEVW